MKKIAFQTLGCKLNFSETSSISRQFGDEGFEQVAFDAPADIYVINSCSVTRNAEKRCKTLVKQALRKNPQAHVAVIGCFSQINPEEIKAIPGVDIVLGNADKFNLFEHIRTLQSNSQGSPSEIDVAVDEPDTFIPSFSMDDRTRSFFKIQDGCDYFCSYCTIPLARGRSRSNTIAQTIETATRIAQTNMKEIVLSGVNIGDFGKEHGEDFLGFLQELIKVEGINRIRISSVEPDLLSDQIIELVAAQPKLMPHFHIPLQAGSDQVLKDMGRRYNTALFASRVARIKALIPHACIAADLIVGFPTETHELFQQSYDFIRKADVSYVHVFTYSERANTRAVKYQQQVPVHERNQRSKIMQQLSAHKKDVFYEANKGHCSEVLWEKENIKGWMYGFTENYIKAKRPFDAQLVNTTQKIVLNHCDSDGVYLADDKV
ncbi:MAG: tRNA (N(6)-L-threonylcarbamoyladenosine(37)-C(2))-methylthiotransferase MtaB [Bacteroidales bacterium]